MWAVLRARWLLLLVAGLAIFIPVGLIEVIDDELQASLVDPELLGVIDAIEIGGAALLHAVGALLGEVLFAGVVAAAVVAEREHHESTPSQFLKQLPVLRLIAADLLYALVVIVGLVLLIVPGILFMIWYALVAPAIKIERLRLRAAFRRSRELVRTRFWLVLAFVLPVIAFEETLAAIAHSGALWVLGDGFLGDWLAATLANLITAPLFALAVSVLFFELRQSSSAQTESR